MTANDSLQAVKPLLGIGSCLAGNAVRYNGETNMYPLIVPVTLLKHHFSDHPNAYSTGQVFLDPYPDELRVRKVA